MTELQVCVEFMSSLFIEKQESKSHGNLVNRLPTVIIMSQQLRFYKTLTKCGLNFNGSNTRFTFQHNIINMYTIYMILNTKTYAQQSWLLTKKIPKIVHKA